MKNYYMGELILDDMLKNGQKPEGEGQWASRERGSAAVLAGADKLREVVKHMDREMIFY